MVQKSEQSNIFQFVPQTSDDWYDQFLCKLLYHSQNIHLRLIALTAVGHLLQQYMYLVMRWSVKYLWIFSRWLP